MDWLTQKYKLYIMLRERLLMDTPQLRGSVTKARDGLESLNDTDFRSRGAPPLPPGLDGGSTLSSAKGLA